jgi:hypothetical protein
MYSIPVLSIQMYFSICPTNLIMAAAQDHKYEYIVLFGIPTKNGQVFGKYIIKRSVISSQEIIASMYTKINLLLKLLNHSAIF